MRRTGERSEGPRLPSALTSDVAGMPPSGGWEHYSVCHVETIFERQLVFVLALLCLGLSGWAAQTVISRGFYALGSTWLPTIVGTAVAFCTIPLYSLLRREWGAIGLAIGTAVAILTYVAVLGWLQRHRFSREAAIRGDRLDRLGGFLSASLRMAFATGIAIAGGLATRLLLPHVLSNMDFFIVIMGSLILCAIGLGIYVFVARQLDIREFAEVESMLVHRLKLLGGNQAKTKL